VIRSNDRTPRTYKQCKLCDRVVEWRKPVREYRSHSVIYPFECPGNNSLHLCGKHKAPFDTARADGVT
jgi:hypothetical protein